MITIQWGTRKAVYTIPSESVAYTLKREKGKEYIVYVHGIFQYMDEDSADAYFICEFEDGTCCYADPRHIRFVDGGPDA